MAYYSQEDLLEQYADVISSFETREFGIGDNYIAELQQAEQFEKSIAIVLQQDSCRALEVKIGNVQRVLDGDMVFLGEEAYVLLSSYGQKLLLDTYDLQNLEKFNAQMMRDVQESFEALDGDVAKMLQVAVAYKITADLYRYTAYIADNIIDIYRFFIDVIDVLLDYGYDLLALEFLSYIDNAIAFLSKMYNVYSLSKKSFLTHKVIQELEKFRDEQIKKLECLF